MKPVFRFLFGLVFLAGCAGEQSARTAATFEQEGIGGDLAAFYAKSITAASLQVRYSENPEKLDDLQARLRSTPVFSDNGLSDIVVRKNGLFVVDRQKIRTAPVCDVAEAFIRALGRTQLEVPTCSRVGAAVARVKKRTWNLLLIMRQFAEIQPHRRLNDGISGAPFAFDMALQSVSSMQKVLDETVIQEVGLPVYDRAGGARKGPELMRVDTITYRNQKMIKIDQGRIAELPELAPFVPIFMLHELNHVANTKELPDRVYGQSQDLFTMWLDL